MIRPKNRTKPPPIPDSPKFQDKVKHRLTNVVGTVIAVYPIYDGAPRRKRISHWVFDVRAENENSIWYESPAENWDVMLAYKTNNPEDMI